MNHSINRYKMELAYTEYLNYKSGYNSIRNLNKIFKNTILASINGISKIKKNNVPKYLLLLLRRHTTMPLMYIWLTTVRWTSQTGKLLQQGLGVILHEDTTVFPTFSTQRSSSSVTIKHALVYQKVLLLMLLFRIFWVILKSW